MQHKDTELMKQIKGYIIDFCASHKRTPSTTEISRKFGIARSTAQNYLVAMNNIGLIFYSHGVLKAE
jgi:repressor LexA